MKISLKSKAAAIVSNNDKWNKKALQMKKSWDEVEGILKSTKKGE